MKKDKKLKKLFLSLETLRRLEGGSLVNVVGAQESVVQCTLYDSCEGTCGDACGTGGTRLQCTLVCDAK